ncbi:hypothetical protein AB6A40_003258 [Gnathostoma spinigerum]|uniref:Uncharacterized protein n=1 Tax=Gnathostoma spinigerum TaxID=75299 RepID=A0ABD6EGT1_9BILA
MISFVRHFANASIEADHWKEAYIGVWTWVEWAITMSATVTILISIISFSFTFYQDIKESKQVAPDEKVKSTSVPAENKSLPDVISETARNETT